MGEGRKGGAERQAELRAEALVRAGGGLLSPVEAIALVAAYAE